ncbi:MAG: hypothetical protein L6W00_20370 [Lentisphaeria bacterium]|nr:MAG: hypothetical protein L6W00_20370 [Lentisphaeria bacterium]
MNTKLPVSRIQCEPDRTYNKADDMHLRASIRSRLDKGLKPLLQPVALKKLENNPDYDYAVDDGRRRFLALLDFKFTELELGQDAILIDGDSKSTLIWRTSTRTSRWRKRSPNFIPCGKNSRLWTASPRRSATLRAGWRAGSIC